MNFLSILVWPGKVMARYGAVLHHYFIDYAV